jgi:putative intracellular protease/amidase
LPASDPVTKGSRNGDPETVNIVYNKSYGPDRPVSGLKMNTKIVLFDGFDFMDVIGPYEVFMAAKTYSQEVTVNFVSAERKRHVKSGMDGPRLSSSGKIDLERGGILIIAGVFASVNDNGPNSFIALLKRAMETDLIHY